MKMKAFFLGFSLVFVFSVNAQLEGAYINLKTFKAIGYGGHLNFKFPISEGGYLTTEGGFYLFKKNESNVAVAPVLLGYQHTLDRSGTGFFVEPLAGYTFGGTDITKVDEEGNDVTVVNRDGVGEYVNQSVKGITGGLAAGYIFSGNTPLLVGLRYERVFVSNDPGVNLVGVRITWPLFGGKSE